MATFKRILLIAGISIVLIGVAAGALAMFGTISDGFRVGRIVKFSKKGLIFKTYEGQLNLGAITQDASGVSSSIWPFSVYQGDDEVVKAIEDATTSNYNVKLYYKEKLFQFDWWGETKYFIYRVERVDN
ncbi:MAG: 6-phosphogluconate dehydrogenase [Bacteroidia bacterium]|nr:6-phosphogluconate dehydrogenase [Bacteroidia bacterium]